MFPVSSRKWAASSISPQKPLEEIKNLLQGMDVFAYDHAKIIVVTFPYIHSAPLLGWCKEIYV